MHVLTTTRSPLTGLFSESNMPWEIDRRWPEIASRVPSLSEMAISAVQVLSELAREEGAPCMPTLSTAPRPSSPQVLSQLAGEEGFFLMVEGSKIDKAAHPNDPGAPI